MSSMIGRFTKTVPKVVLRVLEDDLAEHQTIRTVAAVDVTASFSRPGRAIQVSMPCVEEFHCEEIRYINLFCFTPVR